MRICTLKFISLLTGVAAFGAAYGLTPATTQADWANASSAAVSSDPVCGEISPHWRDMGEAYFDLDEKPSAFTVFEKESTGKNRTGREKSTAQPNIDQSKFLTALLDGRLSEGKGHVTDCVGSADRVQPRTKSIELEDITAKLSPASWSSAASAHWQGIEIRAYEYDPERQLQVLKRESAFLPIADNSLLLNTADLYLSTQRQRQATLEGSYLKETLTSGSLQEQGITLKQRVYVNGVLAQWRTWYLVQ